MKATTTSHGNWKQSRVYLGPEEWREFLERLVADRADGLVMGWTTLPRLNGGRIVIVTHNGGEVIH